MTSGVVIMAYKAGVVEMRNAVAEVYLAVLSPREADHD